VSFEKTAALGVVEIRSDWRKLLGLFALGILMTGLAGLIAFGKVGNLQANHFRYLIICLGFGFFGLCTLVIGWRFMQAGEVVLRLSPENIWIKSRGDGVTVPWRIVSSVSRAGIHKQSFLVLNMSDEDYKALKQGAVAGALHRLNKMLNVTGIPIAASGMSISIDQLEALVARYVT
jgi:hypothetical protein